MCFCILLLLQEIKMEVKDLRQCDKSKNSDLVFKDPSFWMLDKKTMEINCTLEVKREVDGTINVSTHFENYIIYV